MSTFQHTIQSFQRTRMILAAIAAAAVLAVTVALVASNGIAHTSVPSISPSGGHVSQAEAQRQLASVSGARFGTARPNAEASSPQDPKQQLEAVAGARYNQPYNAR